MTELTLQFEIDEPERAAALAAAIEERLKDVVGPEGEVEAAPPEATRSDLAEVATLILAAVTIVRSGADLTEEIRRLFTALRKLKGEFDELRGVFLERDGQRVSIDDLTDETAAELASP